MSLMPSCSFLNLPHLDIPYYFTKTALSESPKTSLTLPNPVVKLQSSSYLACQQHLNPGFCSFLLPPKNIFLYLASRTHFCPNFSLSSQTASSQYVFAGSFPYPSPHWRAQSLLVSFYLIPLVIPPGFMALNTTSRF